MRVQRNPLDARVELPERSTSCFLLLRLVVAEGHQDNANPFFPGAESPNRRLFRRRLFGFAVQNAIA